MSAAEPHTSATPLNSIDDAVVAGVPKRKADDAGNAQTRAKRNRYTSIAWEFKEMDARIATLQDQVNSLYHQISFSQSTEPSVPGLEATTFPQEPSGSMAMSQSSSSPNNRRSRNTPGHPRFQGPTSAAFSFHVAKSSLKRMGITALDDSIDEGMVAYDGTPESSPQPQPQPSAQVHPSKDPLWAISKVEAVRLIHSFDDEMGVMYPFLDIEKMIRHANLLYTFIETAARTGLTQCGLPGADSVDDDDTSILKAVLAAAITMEGSGQSDLGKRLFESVRDVADRRLWGFEVDMKGLELLAVLAMYHFMRDEEALAWRVIGVVARMCLEMGLHRREVLDSFDDEDRRWAVRLFWSVYCLDRRWSFGTGMPFALQDSDLDPQLLEPDDSTPYLTAMIAYSHISSKVWRTVASFNGTHHEIDHDQIEYLDYQVIQWHKSVPASLQLFDPDTGEEAEAATRAIRRLRILLYLRLNQMRILIYRPVLHSATNIMEHRPHARTVVDVAKDTIRMLSHLHQTSDIYQAQQVCFNYFLVSALAVLFLAVSHAPAQFSGVCRDEFYLALDLVKRFSAKSYISKRLWKTIRGLKEVGPKLGLTSSIPPVTAAAADAATAATISSGASGARHHADDAHSTAAVAMAGLAGHAVDDMAIFNNSNNTALPHPQPAPALTPSSSSHSHPQPPHSTPLNGFQMSAELTHLFEAAGGYRPVLPNGTRTGASASRDSSSSGTGGVTSAFAGGRSTAEVGNGPGGSGSAPAVVVGTEGEGLGRGEEELAKIMRDLF
ncbi:MAG: hypothetical protein M1833_007066 [Piccolia ochrophora]|nr:MAG: hypothetical protein M1833_007066 [Piccolia ochrophora]